MKARIDLTAGASVDHRAIFDRLPIALAVLDAEGRIIGTNGAWKSAALDPADRVAALHEGELIELAAGTVEDPATPAEDHLLEGINRVQTRRSGRFDLHYRMQAEGGDRWFLFNATVNEDGGSILSRIETTTQEEVHEALVDLAFHDSLTGLPNRSLVSDRIGMALGRANRSGSWIAVVFADLDGFKVINDSHGHLVGDQVLVEVARRLLTVVRAEDTCGRWGGDEFVLVLELPDRDALDVVLERVIESLEPPFDVQGTPMRLSASLGVAMAHHLVPVDEVLRLADDAMYKSKRDKHPFTVVTM